MYFQERMGNEDVKTVNRNKSFFVCFYHKEATFLLTTQSLHTFSIAPIISGLTIVLIQTHKHKATAVGFSAFCARHFSKYDKHQGTQLLQFRRISFQKNTICHLIKHLIC